MPGIKWIRDPKVKAQHLQRDLLAAEEGSCELDGRLWCLLHRVNFGKAVENPLTGQYQVQYMPNWKDAYVGKASRSWKYADVPMWSKDLGEAWVLAHQSFRGHHWEMIITKSGGLTVQVPGGTAQWPIKYTEGSTAASKSGALLLCAAVAWGLENDLVPKFQRPLAGAHTHKPWVEDARLEEANGERPRDIRALRAKPGKRKPIPIKGLKL